MTAYTIAAGVTRYFDDNTWFIAGQGGVRTGGDTYAINGGTLIIDTDVRYGAACTPTTGPIASVTISTTLGGTFRIDASNTWLIPFDTGTGNVPAMGTTISQGAVTGRLCGVWSAINVAPISTGSAMPATGFVKVCRKAGGNYAAGALTGIGANATGPDVLGWVEVSADEAAGSALTIPRLGQWITRGGWFELGTTSGAAGQLVNLPSSGQALYSNGVWIENAPGSDTYTFWPSQNALGTATSPAAVASGGWTTANNGTDVRSRFVQALAGQIRIGSDGTNNVGNVPVAGCRIRMPNVILVTNTTAARAISGYPTNVIANRFETATTNGGVIDVEHATGHWFLNVSQAFSCRFVNSAFSDQVILSEVASPIELTNFHVNPLNNQDAAALTISLCFAGLTATTCSFGRSGAIGTSDHSANISTSIGVVLSNCYFYQGTVRTNATAYGLTLTQCTNTTMTNCTFVGGVLLTTCVTATLTNSISFERHAGTTQTGIAGTACVITTKCNNITISGWAFPAGVANVHPYNAIVSVTTSDNIRIRNIGSAASPVSGGTVNIMRTAIFDGGTNSNVEIKRVYVINTNFMPFSASISANTAPANSSTGYTLENFWGDTDVSQLLATLNTQVKGCRWPTNVTAQAAVYGLHFLDFFTSTTAGAVVVMANEKTTVEPSASSYQILSGTPSFTSAGTISMRIIGDSVEWTTPYFIIGHTGFATTIPTITGTSVQNLNVDFDIDNGSGFSGSYSKLVLTKLTGSGISGQTNVSMANTTGVQIGDSIFGTGIAAGATVQSITNGTTVVVAPANSGTVSGVLTFSRLRLASIANHTTGFRMKIRVTANANDVTTLFQQVIVRTVTDSTAQTVQYPLDVVPASLTITNLQPNSEVRVYRLSDDVEIAGIENTGTSFQYNYSWSGSDTDVYIRIHHLNYQWLSYTVTLGQDGITIPVVQITDRQYENA
jgi:uncharacterized membrane protein